MKVCQKRLSVVRCGVSPLVWRRLLVVNETSLSELHEILQNAFDWSSEHLHRFFPFALLPFETTAKRRILLMRLCFHSLLISCSVAKLIDRKGRYGRFRHASSLPKTHALPRT
jgi:hypothetical protein